MRQLSDLLKGEERVFINLYNEQEITAFLEQAESEGFLISGKPPTQCKCENVMILNKGQSVSFLHGTIINIAYGCRSNKIVDFAKYMSGASHYLSEPKHF